MKERKGGDKTIDFPLTEALYAGLRGIEKEVIAVVKTTSQQGVQRRC